MKVSVFVPAHITSFFTIANDNDPLKKGSCGGGILLDKGVLTTVKSSNKENKVEIKVNGKKDHAHEFIVVKTLELIKKDFKIKQGLKINQKIEVPLGSGFGSSASSALGVAIAFFKLFDENISLKSASQYAHRAEIELGSGLGDVIAQTSKGIVVRKKPGSLGIGKVESIGLQNELSNIYVITKTLGEIDTGSIIENPHHQKKINEVGLEVLKKFLVKPKIEHFLKCSLEFAKKTNLINENVLEIVNEMNKNTLGASMAMLGNTAFALSKNPYSDIEGSIISKIDNVGIKIL
ncbi:MAG: GHMP kinase [Methanobacteriaceae archaeon]|jgi:pantoate kinase|nr:GHMP kinase [Candidatus Methanorudis spinitermitis]